MEVINVDGIIRVEDGDRFVEGKAKMSYGYKRKIKNLQRPNKMRYKGDDDIIMYMEDYDDKKDIDLNILSKQLTGWSRDDAITFNNIKEDEELGDLFDRFLEEVKEINNLKADLGKSNQNDEE